MSIRNVRKTTGYEVSSSRRGWKLRSFGIQREIRVIDTGELN